MESQVRKRMKERRKRVVKEQKGSLKKRESIMDVATSLFLERGYSEATTEDVCRLAGVKKPSLYHFFMSKRQLFFSCHMKAINELLKPYLEQASSIAEPEARIRFMIREFTSMICKAPELRVFIHGSMSIREKYFGPIRKEWKRHYILLRDTISELQSSGKASQRIKPSLSALFLLGMITWITFWFDYSRQENIDVISQAADDLIFYGLFGEKRQGSRT